MPRTDRQQYKFSDAEIRAIRKSTKTQGELASRYKVTQATISKIVNRITYRNVD